jgi:hypothetical protein
MAKPKGFVAHKTTVSDCRRYVEDRKPFQTSNGQLFGMWCPSGVYAVFSYGQHWPLFVWEPKTKQWFANMDKYGTTTSKHHSKAHPFSTSTYHLTCEQMKALVAHGYTQVVAWRLTGSEEKVA